MYELVFSYAENEVGKMVHVDDVPRGLACHCVCPYCREKLLARHGIERTHHFAHHSNDRKATLEICYMVTLYKLAEQIIQEKKLIHAPSYYGIFPETDIKFEKVVVDGCYERDDKQPDIVATTNDGKQYLIEFIFKYKVQHKKPIDYANLSCLEIDLSKQSLETLEAFLLTSNEDKSWVNNENYFSQIENRYAKASKLVCVKDKTECGKCKLKMDCCCVKVKKTGLPLTIENNGREYLLCKTESFNKEYENLEKTMEEKRKQEEKTHRLNMLESYLLDSVYGKRNVSSEFFSQINFIYADKGKQVRTVETCICDNCPFREENDCVGIKVKSKLIVFVCNGNEYRICEPITLKQELLKFNQYLISEGWNGAGNNEEAKRYLKFLQIVDGW